MLLLVRTPGSSPVKLGERSSWTPSTRGERRTVYALLNTQHPGKLGERSPAQKGWDGKKHDTGSSKPLGGLMISMMETFSLKTVYLEFFDHERETASPNSSLLDRQIRLHGNENEMLYISWTWERQKGLNDPPYSIGINKESFFNTPPSFEIDASSGDLWSGLIGQEISLEFLDPDPQILQVKSPQSAIYCYTWGTDTVSISGTDPRQGGNRSPE